MHHDPSKTSIEPRPAPRAELADLLAHTGLSIAFQPIIALSDGGIVAYEALARPNPRIAASLGDSIAEIFARASRAGVVPDLDRAAHTLALGAAPYLDDRALLFLNAAPASAAHPDFALRMARLASHAAIAPARIVIELTELGDAGDTARLDRNLADLRALGFSIALDDVGAGHNDLRRILRLRPAWLKLDRALVERLESDHYTRSLVAALGRFAGHNAVRVVAEGVELPSQARAVADLGITHAQGYWFARPAPLAEVVSARCSDRAFRRWRSASLAA